MNLHTLLAPIEIQDFVQTYWERQVLHIERTDPGYYEKLASVQDIDRYLFSNHNLAISSFSFYLGKQKANLQDWSTVQRVNENVSLVVDHPKVFHLFQQGFSMYLSQPDKLFPQLKEFLIHLEDFLKVKTHLHLIISPPNSKGFLPHIDPYGVFVMQLSGTKVWNLFDRVTDTSFSQGKDMHHYSDHTPQQVKELTAGSMLYLPRGWVHSVHTGSEYSIHLSLGINPPAGSDLLSILQRTSQNHSFFREYIPYGFLGSDREQEEYEEAFKEQLISFIREANMFDLLDASLLENMEPINSNRFENLIQEQSPSLSSHTLLRVKPGLSYTFQEEEERSICGIIFEGKNLRFPISWKAELKHIMKAGSIKIRDLGVSLQISELEKIQVAKNMIQAGFLEVYPLPDKSQS